MYFNKYDIYEYCSIQVFHVVEHTGEGGQTLLVDGFHAAENIRRQYPDSFDILTKAVVPHQYFDEQRKMRSLGTILKLHPTTGELLSIRYCFDIKSIIGRTAI